MNCHLHLTNKLEASRLEMGDYSLVQIRNDVALTLGKNDIGDNEDLLTGVIGFIG